MEEVARQLQQEDVGDNVPCAARMHVSRESGDSGSHAMGKVEEMMTELGGAKIPVLRRMSALLAKCLKDAKDQMLRMDEIGENCENLKTKVVPYWSNKAEGRAVSSAPM